MIAAAETVERLLARIEEVEPTVRAFAWFDAGRARALAAEASVTAAGASSELHGTPVGVKDIFDTAGIPTECGTAALAGRVPDASADAVLALERAGAWVIGKTVTAELAFAVPGPTRNPWNLERTPGGSSMGSAAGVAAGLFPVAIGTQTNSSIIMPAALCGVVGFKPSIGAISTRGVLDFSRTLDHVGTFATTVADAAALAWAMFDSPPTPAETAKGPPRLAVAALPPLDEVATAVGERLRTDVDRLEENGAEIEWVELPRPTADAQAVHRTIMSHEAARSIPRLIDSREELLSDVLRRFLAEGASVTASAYRDALAARARIAAAVREALEDFHALLFPAAPDEAPSAETTGDPRYCTLWSLTGDPAIVVPTGSGPGGLPLGLQLVGRRDSDDTLVSVALWVESALAESTR